MKIRQFLLLISACECKNMDGDVKCDTLAGHGECCNNEVYMLEHCKKSCSQCGGVRSVPGKHY